MCFPLDTTPKGPVLLGRHLRVTQVAREDFENPKILGRRALSCVTAYVTTRNARHAHVMTRVSCIEMRKLCCINDAQVGQALDHS